MDGRVIGAPGLRERGIEPGRRRADAALREPPGEHPGVEVIMAGGQVSLLVGIISMLMAILLGIGIGGLAGARVLFRRRRGHRQSPRVKPEEDSAADCFRERSPA